MPDDVNIKKILNAPYWWAISLYVFLYNSMMCVYAVKVRVLGDAALIHVNLTCPPTW